MGRLFLRFAARIRSIERSPARALNFNGGIGSVAYNVTNMIGVVGEFAGYHNGNVYGSGASVNTETYLIAAPKVYKSMGKINPVRTETQFSPPAAIRAVFGVERQTGGFDPADSAWRFRAKTSSILRLIFRWASRDSIRCAAMRGCSATATSTSPTPTAAASIPLFGWRRFQVLTSSQIHNLHLARRARFPRQIFFSAQQTAAFCLFGYLSKARINASVNSTVEAVPPTSRVIAVFSR